MLIVMGGRDKGPPRNALPVCARASYNNVIRLVSYIFSRFYSLANFHSQKMKKKISNVSVSGLVSGLKTIASKKGILICNWRSYLTKKDTMSSTLQKHQI